MDISLISKLRFLTPMKINLYILDVLANKYSLNTRSVN